VERVANNSGDLTCKNDQKMMEFSVAFGFKKTASQIVQQPLAVGFLRINIGFPSKISKHQEFQEC
jgi:hypothetical protein